MCTTNGTRAIAAARGARDLLVGALVNATAVAARVRQIGRDLTLLCAGTNGAVAMEDVVGAGAVLDALLASGDVDLTSDVARIAVRALRGSRNDLLGTLRDACGGRNVAAAGLEADIAFAASLDRLPVVGTVGAAGDALTVTRFSSD
jgi:2-phosphosulfolactate phosphatase